MDRKHLKRKGWNDIITEYLMPVGGLLFLLKCNYETKLVPRFLPSFLQSNVRLCQGYIFRRHE